MAFLPQESLEKLGFKKLGKNARISDKASIYDADRIEIGDNSRVDDFCVLSGKVTLGRNVSAAVFCNLAGGTEGITIEDFSTLAYGCHVFSQSDDYSGATMTNPTIPAKFKSETKRAVHIERYCIVGANSVIFPGVTLAEGTSIGSCSLVRKATEPWSIYYGIPAKRVKARKKDMLELVGRYLSEEEPYDE